MLLMQRESIFIRQ